MDSKAQTSLEYLLIIGGAVIIVAVVIALLAGFGSAGQDQTHQAGQSFDIGLNNLRHSTT
jgi:uncharacterized protein (UPF0333 family)